MIFSLETFTLFHVALSLIGILAGLIVLYGLITSNSMNVLTGIFLVTTAATTLTGLLFPFNGFTPALATGVVSTIVLIPTIYARYRSHLMGHARSVYVIGAVISLYLNSFVLVVQSFLKIPQLHVLAPLGNEPPFAITQGLVLVFFVVTGFLAYRRFHPATA